MTTSRYAYFCFLVVRACPRESLLSNRRSSRFHRSLHFKHLLFLSQFTVENDEGTVYLDTDGECDITSSGTSCSGNACSSANNNNCYREVTSGIEAQKICIKMDCENWSASCDVDAWTVGFYYASPPPPSPSPPPTPAPPSPSPPPLPDSWTCDASFYNSNDGCDCECGVWDPDCEDREQDIYNCGATPSEPSPDHICRFSDSTGTCELIPIPPYIKDPDFKYQYWYLGPNGANVVAAWELGFTGEGVHIRVNDDCLDYTDPEFSSKILPGWKDPMPKYCTTFTHGTSCAGIAAAASNGECGVGVAYDAYVSGASLIGNYDPEGEFVDGRDTSNWPMLLEDGACDADSHGGHGVDISSNSWGPYSCSPPEDPGDDAHLPLADACPFLSENKYSPCGDMSSWPFPDLSCSASETWLTPQTISFGCKSHIHYYCGASSYHAEIGYMDPACTDYYDLFVSCEYWSLANDEIAALQRGTTYGRGGRGIVYVFAAGNTGAQAGDVNDGGYTKSIFTISVGAIGRDNQHSVYSTGGAAVLISAPAGDTDQRFNTYEVLPMDAGKCRVGDSNFVGTSFAAPIVSGVVALMLEANPELGWRDVQDILVRTAVVIDIAPDSPNDSWVTNAAGLSHSYDYGFGKVDAKAAVILAQNYGATNIKHNFDLVFTNSPNSTIESVTTSSMSVLDASVISSAQHVVVYVNITHSWRGDLSLSLTSPSGVTSELINFKTLDDEDLLSTETWKFMTLRNWGELPADLQGSWVLRIEDKDSSLDHGVLHSWRLEILGNDSSGEVSGTLTAECAAKSGGYSDVIGGGQCYTTEKSDDELTRAESCSVAPPSNGALGTCPETILSGLLCTPTCDAGYFASGVSSCSDGTFTSATCSARLCAANEYVSSKSCVACPAEKTNDAGDDASGSDTACDEPAPPRSPPPLPVPPNSLGDMNGYVCTVFHALGTCTPISSKLECSSETLCEWDDDDASCDLNSGEDSYIASVLATYASSIENITQSCLSSSTCSDESCTVHDSCVPNFEGLQKDSPGTAATNYYYAEFFKCF